MRNAFFCSMLVALVLSLGRAEERPAAQPLQKSQEEAVNALARGLEHQDFEQRESAQEQLVAMGLNALPLLMSLESHPLLTMEGKVRLATVYGAIRTLLLLGLGDERRATTLKALNAAQAEILLRIGVERLEHGALAILFHARTLQGIDRFKILEYLVARPGEKDHEVVAVLSPELWRHMRKLILCGDVPLEMRWREAAALKIRKLDDLLKTSIPGATPYEALDEGLRIGSTQDVSAYTDMPPDDKEVTMLLMLKP